MEEADVFGLSQEGGQTCIQVFFFRSFQNWGNRAYYPKADRSHEAPEIMASFLAQFYDDKPIPDLVLLSHDIEERGLLEEALSTHAGRKVEVAVPQRGEKKNLVEHAVTNAREALGRRLAESTAQGKLLQGVAEAFGLDAAPNRIEVYDNSHISGTNAVGAMIVENIDDDPQFAPRSVAPGESRAVSVAADLVTREVDVHSWTPMQPFFMPAGILDNMPNFQRGVIAALGRFSTELMDQLGRTRGSSQTDRDLEQARGFLNEQPNIWIWQPSVSLMPSATSAQKYRAGRDKLVSYNKRLAAGQAVFERRADNLQALVDRIANDEGADSAVIDQQIIEQAGNLFDFHCDDIFYFNKGRLYANYLLLRELGRDFDSVIKEKGLTNAWNGMVETFRIAAQLEPWIVWNGYPDALLIPNHLAAQGFYLLRARTQLREISAILLK